MSSAEQHADEPPAARRLRFQKHQHLRSPAEFQRVYDGKQRAGDQRLLVFAARNENGVTRIGLSVSKRHGGSVQRQRLKRLMREAFRLSQHDIPQGLDLILIPRPECSATVDDFRESLVALASLVARRLRKAPPSAEPSAPSHEPAPTPPPEDAP